jgi:hypothetical protein
MICRKTGDSLVRTVSEVVHLQVKVERVVNVGVELKTVLGNEDIIVERHCHRTSTIQ